MTQSMHDDTQARTRPGPYKSVIDTLPVTVEAVLGVAKTTVGELNGLKAGDTITLDTLLGDSVVLRLNGMTIAAGELVSMGDHFAIRITSIAHS